MDLKKIIASGVISLSLLANTACSQFYHPKCLNNGLSDALDDSPLSTISSQASQILTDKELTELYKKYFPNGRLELSYPRSPEEKTSQTRTFLRPQIGLRQGLDYQIETGIETKY